MSLATLVGPERAVASAVGVVPGDAPAEAAPSIQPLALSSRTRRAAKGDHLLSRMRAAVVTANDVPSVELVRLQRVRLRTVLMIAVGAGAFYFLLPQLAQVSDSWKAFKSVDLAWLSYIIAVSPLAYLGAGVGVLGAMRQRLAAGPTMLAQLASSLVNRVTPASISGIALNARLLEKSGHPGGAARWRR